MDDNEMIKAIEQMNLDYIKCIESKEYVLGKKIIRTKNEIKNGKILSQFKRLYNKKRIAKTDCFKINENVDEKTWLRQATRGDIHKKIVVYTCITGGYDIPIEPLIKWDNIEYVIFLPNNKLPDNSKWKYREIPNKLKKYSNPDINRYIKMHPHELFADDYDYSIYVDGNIKICSDISIYTDMVNTSCGLGFHRHSTRDDIYEEVKACYILKKGDKEKLHKQIARYKKEKFPSHYGMLECNFIVAELKNQLGKKLFSDWWNELKKADSGRDQISLPYVLWRNNIDIESLAVLGSNVYKNSKIRFYSHGNN